MLCKGAKEKNWNPALKGTERTLAIYDYTTFGMVSLAFFSRIALTQELPVELAGVEHAISEALLQVGHVRINFSRLGLA
jgi:hypothetical protein